MRIDTNAVHVYVVASPVERVFAHIPPDSVLYCAQRVRRAFLCDLNAASEYSI